MAKGKITIDYGSCKGCELCIAFCKRQRISLGNALNEKGYFAAQVVENGDKKPCLGCALCATVCPEIAITVYRKQRTEDEVSND